jgi:alginate O-acetyltransferase complex protein AlgI
MFGGGVRHATAGLVDADILRGYIMSHFAVCILVTWFMPNTQTILHRFVAWKALLGLVCFVVAVTMMFARGHSPFLYFQF